VGVFSISKNPFSPKGKEPIKDGIAPKVLPVLPKKLSQ
jgi:hypothetical protein